MAACKLKKGGRIYECRYREATLLELITDPELRVQGSDSHYWHWKAKVVETNSHHVAPGEIVEFGITEEAPQYGPQLFRKNVYEVGFENAEPILPPFDTTKGETACETVEDVNYITGLTFCSDERGITCQGHPLLEKLSIHPIGEGMLWIGNSRGPLFYANSFTGKARQLLDENSNLVDFEDQDFDWEKLKTVEYPYDVKHKHVDYGGLGRYNDFRDGICCLSWMLHPDGRYYADEDGFGMEDDNEENIYCIIDSNLRIVIPWQPMTDKEMAVKMREAREIIKKEDKTSVGDIVEMNDYERKALEFIAKMDDIVQNKSQESIDSLFKVLDSLSLPAGFCLGLKLAGEVGIGDESWFYTYQGKDPIETFGCRIPDSTTLFKDILVAPTVMGAWQAYLIYIAPTILPTFWHGGYIAREYFFDRGDFKGVTSNWARGSVDVKLSQIPQPTVVMKDGMAVVSCPYWNDWRGLVLESVEVNFNSDGTVTLTPHAKVLYEYNCGICY